MTGTVDERLAAALRAVIRDGEAAPLPNPKRPLHERWAEAVIKRLADSGVVLVEREALAAAIERTDWPSYVRVLHPSAADPREEWVADHYAMWSLEMADAILAALRESR